LLTTWGGRGDVNVIGGKRSLGGRMGGLEGSVCGIRGAGATARTFNSSGGPKKKCGGGRVPVC